MTFTTAEREVLGVLADRAGLEPVTFLRQLMVREASVVLGWEPEVTSAPPKGWKRVERVASPGKQPSTMKGKGARGAPSQTDAQKRAPKKRSGEQ